MSETIRVQGILPASAALVFRSWLSGPEHTSMTGAKTSYERDGAFTAWDGYIHGRTLGVQEPHRIVQAWRSAEFPPDAPDSRLEICLQETPEGTELTLLHSDIPEGQGSGYQSGWQEYYLLPMTEYFRALAKKPPRPLPVLAPQPQLILVAAATAAPRVQAKGKAQVQGKAKAAGSKSKPPPSKSKKVVATKVTKARAVSKLKAKAANAAQVRAKLKKVTKTQPKGRLLAKSKTKPKTTR